MKYFKKLIGDRIYLSPRGSEDAEQFTEWMNDFQVTDYVGRSAQVLTLNGEKRYLEENDNSEGAFVIVTLNENKMIGTVCIDGINHKDRTGTLGVFIGDGEYRNNSYGTEAIRLILEFGFRYLNLNNIRLGLVDCNERAKRCYEKCGFKECGRVREAYFVNGKYHDFIYMDILAREFEGDWIRNKNI